MILAAKYSQVVLFFVVVTVTFYESNGQDRIMATEYFPQCYNMLLEIDRLVTRSKISKIVGSVTVLFESLPCLACEFLKCF